MASLFAASNRSRILDQAARWRHITAARHGALPLPRSAAARRARHPGDSRRGAFAVPSRRPATRQRPSRAPASAEVIVAFWPGAQRTSPSSQRALHKQIVLGSVIGLWAALAGAWLFGGGSALVLALATLAGSGIGALIGLLLWVGSNALSDDAVIPPAPGDARPGKPRHHR
jgi:hypothetical protein